MRLANKVAVITGAGSGIGRTTSLRFVAEGAKVVISDNNREGEDETLRQVKEIGGEAIIVSADIADPVQVKNLMMEAAANYGKIDILCNNAGIGSPSDARITELEEDAWDLILGINLRGTFLCCKYGIPYLVRNGGGSIVNVASIIGLRANRNIPCTAYGVSKAGIVALTLQVSYHYAKDQVRVNAICPGPVHTPILEPTFDRDPDVKSRILDSVPLGRMGTTDDIANLILFLASDESSWMTGSIITIDGGRSV
jgi:NAD(P)-dependent dehydrogenase (short-subunit alcohol dehydrogenase family)